MLQKVENFIGERCRCRRPNPFDHLDDQKAMPKRASEAADLPAGKIQSNGKAQHHVDGDEEMGEFEDRWEDDIESEEEED